MKERPILFSGEMVRAILDSRKSMTRRVVKPQPSHMLVEPRVGLTIGMDPADDGAVWYDADGINPGREVRCPYGCPLDRLWVKETWHCPKQLGGTHQREKLLHREAFEAHRHVNPPKWSSPRFMPRWASRITLELTDVRVERVQEISEEDARAEGVSVLPLQSADDPSAWWQTGPGENQSRTPRIAFSKLWDSINGPRGYGWDANPFVWALTFRRVED